MFSPPIFRAGLFGAVPAMMASAAGAASPTPNLPTGDYAALRTLVVVGDPSAYGGDGVAVNVHPASIHYDAAAQTYVLFDYEGAPGTRFAPGEIVSANATYTTYRDSQSRETLRLFNQGAANPKLVLTYVTYGKWVQPQTAPIRFADNYLVFGQLTPAAAVPRTGSASYTSILDGTYQNRNGTYRLTGNAAFTANFATGTMGMVATPLATSLANGSQLAFGTLSGSGFIDRSTASFNAVTPYIGTTRFSAKGNFYGPSATEIGGAFTIKSGVGGFPGEGGGAFVGRKN